MSKKFQGRYGVNDGYAGGARPHHFTVYDYELEDDMTDDQLERLYEEAVEESFAQNITPYPERVDEFIAWAREQLAARGDKA